MSGWTIYWMTRIGDLKALLIVATALAGFAVFMGILFEFPMTKRQLKSLLAICAVCGVASALLPTTSEMAAICVIPKIANSETANELGDEAIGLVREWIKELKPKAE